MTLTVRLHKWHRTVIAAHSMKISMGRICDNGTALSKGTLNASSYRPLMRWIGEPQHAHSGTSKANPMFLSRAWNKYGETDNAVVLLLLAAMAVLT